MKAGVECPRLKDLTILDFCKVHISELNKPGWNSSKRIYETTNKKLLELVKSSDLGKCIHVTSEMRALTDPFHRQICEEMRRQNKGGFIILYKVPLEQRRTAASLVEWNLIRWGKGKIRRWEEELRTIDVVANRAVDLFAYEGQNQIQFSVFGHQFILLQERHLDLSKKKRVWFLKSDRISQILIIKAESLIKGAEEIDEGMFREFTLNLSSPASSRCLKKLASKSYEKSSLLRDSIVNYEPDILGVLYSLKTMEFITEDDHHVFNITRKGYEFYNAF
jgi:hypothetical protein